MQNPQSSKNWAAEKPKDKKKHKKTKKYYSSSSDDSEMEIEMAGAYEAPKVEETNSRKPWIHPKPRRSERYTRRPEKDPQDEMALRADFETANPSVDTIRRRAKYR
jgi:hypothetical protein